jgi:hypothetical protein
MRAEVRKLALTMHITVSVGWLGAVACSLVLALTGLTAPDPQLVRAAYVVMDVITAWITIPLSFVSLASGVLQSWVTRWGLVRHYWVVIKLVLTVLATGLLLVHAQPIRELATQAAAGMLSTSDERTARLHLVLDAAAALITLLFATTLSVYKPRGLTRWAA